MRRETGSDAGELRRGWPILTACLIGQMVGVHAVPVFTAGLFLGPLHDDLGWSRVAISAGIMIMTFFNAAIAPVVGWATTRFDSRRIVLFGLAAQVLAYLAMSRMGGSVWVFWSLLAGMAVVAGGSSSVALSRILVGSFETRRGTAIGIALLGTGLTSILGPIAIGAVIAADGWRAGYQAIALSVGLGGMVMGVLFALSAKPAARPVIGQRVAVLPPSGGTFRLLLAFFLIALASGGVVIHFVPLLQDAGLGAAQAAKGAAVLGMSLVVGRLATGLLLDRFDARRLATILMGMSATGFALIGLLHGGWLLLLAPLVGLSMGAELDLMPYMAARRFGVERFGRAYGLFYGAFVIGAGLSTMAYAMLQRLTGDYRLAFVLSACLLGVSVWLFVTDVAVPKKTSFPAAKGLRPELETA